MGSDIHVKSTAGQGSTFWLDIDLPEAESAILGEAGLSPAIIGFKGRSRKILIVDDHDDIRMVLKMMLLPLGFGIAEGINGQDALHKAIAYRPDLILMDLMMPVMNGFETARQIRNTPELQDVIVLAISANAFESTKQESLEAGCHDFLAKPLRFESLLEKLGTYLHLEWIFEPGISTIKSPTDQTTFVLPPASELLALLDAAKSGDIEEIRSRIDHLERLNAAFLPLTKKFHEFARKFQIRQLRHLLETYLQEDSYGTDR
jgi:CheY-like chemotaxis protein